jgi:hypothetical protein
MFDQLFFTACNKRNTMLTTLIDSRNLSKMSSMFNEISKLASSTDYPRWSQTLSTYLGMQKALKVITKTAPVLNSARTNQDEVVTWEELEGIAQGVIILTVHPAITKAVDLAKMVKEVGETCR